LFFKIEIIMPNFNWKSSFKFIKQSFPYELAILMMSMYTRVDAVMIERLLPITGAYETGIYAASYRLLDAANMIPFLFASILIPVFSRNLEYKEEFKPLLYGSLKSLLFLSSLVTVIVIFWGNEILNLLYKDADMAWYYTFVVLMSTFNIVCFNYVFGGFLTAAGKLWFIIKFSFLALFLNIVLNYFLIKSNGAAGAAMATIITQLFMAIAQTLKVALNWKLKFSFKAVFKFVAYLQILILLCMATTYSDFNYMVNIALICTAAVILSFIMRLIDWKTLILVNKNIQNES
jgi:O-antigen/teichoic acid export membrane protein